MLCCSLSVSSSSNLLKKDEIMLTSKEGMLVRIPVNGIRVQGRNTMGVTIMRLNEDDKVVSVAKIVEKDYEEECNLEENKE